jgi:hypothetical protein
MLFRRMKPNGPNGYPKKRYSAGEITNEREAERSVAFSIADDACERTQPIN